MIIGRNAKGHMKCPLVTTLYDVNQVLKNYSNEYYIHLGTGIISFDHVKNQYIDDIMCMICNEVKLNILKDEFGMNSLLKFKAEPIYTCVKVFKACLYSITIEEKDIVVTMTDGKYIKIGEVVDDDFVLPMSETLSYKMSMLNRIQHVPYLTDDEVNDIVTSILIKYMNEYEVRITKEMIPCVNKNTNIRLCVNTDVEVTDIAGTYTDLFILSEIKDVDILMSYKILKI